MAVRFQEKHLFIMVVLIVSMVAFLIEPSYFMTTVILVSLIYFVMKTEKLKYYLITIGIILAIFLSLLIAI